MDRDAITILGSCEVSVAYADALCEELLAKGALVAGPPVSRPCGLRDPTVIDPEVNRITFAQTFE